MSSSRPIHTRLGTGQPDEIMAVRTSAHVESGAAAIRTSWTVDSAPTMLRASSIRRMLEDSARCRCAMGAEYRPRRVSLPVGLWISARRSTDGQEHASRTPNFVDECSGPASERVSCASCRR